MMMLEDMVFGASDKPLSRCVVRLATSHWITDRGLCRTQSITIMRRQSVGYQPIHEDASYVGAKDVFSKIVNLDELPDGLYEVVLCDQVRDWETGYIEDYNYKLIPVDPTS